MLKATPCFFLHCCCVTLELKSLLTPDFESTKVQCDKLKSLCAVGEGLQTRAERTQVTEAHPPSMGTAVKAINLEHTVQPVVGSGVLSASLGPHCVVEGLLPRMAFPAVSRPIGPSATLIAFPHSPTV